MAGIRTVMVTAPAMLGDLIKRLAQGRVELDIVGELGDRAALAPRLQALQAALIVIGLQPNEADAQIRDLLRELPASKIITLSHDGRSMNGYELRVSRTALADLSPEDLIRFVRSDPLGDA